MKNNNENKMIGARIIITILLIMCAFLGLTIMLGVDIIKDKNAYIYGLQSDRKICNDKLDEQIWEYTKIKNELNKYKKRYGELDG